MTVFTGARFGLSWGFVAGNSGWGASFNLQSRLLETMLALTLLSDTTAAPPTSPAEDDSYYVPAAATDAWAGQSGTIAAFQGGQWQFYTIPNYMRARIVDRGGFYYFNAGAWVAEVTSGSGGVTSVAGHTGIVTLAVGDITGAAPLSSPVFTGSPKAPDQNALTRNQVIANTKYVDDAVSAVAGARVNSVAGRTGAVTLTHGDITDWGEMIAIYAVSSTLGTAAYANTSEFKTAGAAESWGTLPASAQNLPLPFVIIGKPTAGQVYHIVMTQGVTIPANFAGSLSYQGVQATAPMAFTVNKISGGNTTTIGTVTLGTASKTTQTLSTQAQATFAAGDVLQLVAPAVQDATGSDIGLTIQAMKV